MYKCVKLCLLGSAPGNCTRSGSCRSNASPTSSAPSTAAGRVWATATPDFCRTGSGFVSLPEKLASAGQTTP
jgi:hypothetical protein